jgi:hypothetical protein
VQRLEPASAAVPAAAEQQNNENNDDEKRGVIHLRPLARFVFAQHPCATSNLARSAHAENNVLVPRARTHAAARGWPRRPE